VVAVGVAAIALFAPGSAPAQSAFPVKAADDGGVIDLPQFNVSGYVDFGPSPPNYARGYDACTYTEAYSTLILNYQQYNVAGCVPIQTPWIALHGWQTRGWAVYCPDSAPNSWISSLGGALQQWSGTSSVEEMNEIQSENTFGPKPPAKSDYYTTNWGISTHHWLYVVGCSPEKWENVGDGGAYCCGQGTSGAPHFSSGAAGSSAAQAAAGGALMLKGPARRETPYGSGYYSLTREFDLSPHTSHTYSVKCRRGYRLRFARHGIGWFMGREPGKRDGNVRDRRHRFGKRGFKVTTTTDRNVKPGKVRLQLEIGCGRPGVSGPTGHPPAPFG
jgi:hypothetical protein